MNILFILATFDKCWTWISKVFFFFAFLFVFGFTSSVAAAAAYQSPANALKTLHI